MEFLHLTTWIVALVCVCSHLYTDAQVGEIPLVVFLLVKIAFFVAGFLAVLEFVLEIFDEEFPGMHALYQWV
jgi:hypothetical protein